jgi:hypothetical protein
MNRKKLKISEDEYWKLFKKHIASPLTPDEEKQSLLYSLKGQPIYEPEFVGTNITAPPPRVSSYINYQPPQNRSAYGYVSPTDIDAGGRYSYQEPEVDEQGVYYGYKILNRHCERLSCDLFVSPNYYIEWVDGKVVAHSVPSIRTMDGIHCTKRPDHPELANYTESSWIGYNYTVFPHRGKRLQKWALVKCALYGDKIVETEQGFRAHKAMIVGVYDDGNWKSYQDYQECARAYSGIYTKEVWEEWRDLP